MLRKGLCSIALTASLCTAANASDIHRVITTLDAANRSTTLFDNNVQLHAPGKSGLPGAVLWITDSSPPGFSQEDTAKRPIGIPPPNNGTVLRVFEFPPLDDAKVASMDPNFLMKVVGPTAPARGVPPSNPLVHRTRTVDYAIVISGEIDMMLDDKTVHLKAGDVVVQQATNHAWLNHGKEPCRVIFVMMDSKEP
jgi:mannose-6-phosphate isomerase-like protein (cupin superfamily)